MAKLCPWKEIMTLKTRNDYEVYMLKDASKLEKTFGQCDERLCMAYDSYTGKCTLIERGIRK